MSEPERLILHVDLDAFYASVEELDRPELAGRPVIVGGTGGRGVVSAASYAARRFGVGSAMPMHEARRRCPEGHFLPSRMERYREVSAQVFEHFHAATPWVEALSVDEAFLDFSDDPEARDDPYRLADRLRREIREATGLTVSVGAAPNKSVAKLASELAKPDGRLIVPPEEIHLFLDSLPVERLWGVGKATAQRLRRGGYTTFGALRRAPEPRIRGILGRQAPRLQALAAGRDPRPVRIHRPAKSVSNETTFGENVGDAATAARVAAELAAKVAGRLRDRDLVAATAVVKLRTADFRTQTRQRRLEPPSAADRPLCEAVQTLIREWWSEQSHPPSLRLLGVGTRDLAHDTGQLGLFPEKQDQGSDRLLDEARERFGPGRLRRGL